MPEIAIERDGDCWSISLDRAQKANALSADLVEGLIEAVEQAHAAHAAVLVFKGNGRNLSAGFDFGGYESQSEGDLLQRFVRIECLLQAIARSSSLTVAFAHGRNFGAGVDLFAACRWRVAAAGATFRMPGLGFGLVLGTRRFAALVGTDNARELLERLATFDATHGKDIGFVRRIAEPESWPAIVSEARAVANSLAHDHRAALHRTLAPSSDDADLADLVRSASSPGLKQRISAYLAAQPKPSPASAREPRPGS